MDEELTRFVVHELRNVGFALQVSMDAGSDSADEAQTALRHSRAVVGRLGSLASALDLMSWPIASMRVAVEAGVLVAAAVERVAPPHGAHVTGGCSREVFIDPETTTRALANLIAMVAAHAREAIEIEVREHTVLQIILRDRGPGLPTQASRLLDDPRLSRNQEAVGLGPIAARRVFEAHSGSVAARRVESDLVELVIELPFVQD